MTDEARKAIGFLRRVANEWRDDGLDMSATHMSEAADVLESELLFCHVETPRETPIIIGDGMMGDFMLSSG